MQKTHCDLCDKVIGELDKIYMHEIITHTTILGRKLIGIISSINENDKIEDICVECIGNILCKEYSKEEKTTDSKAVVIEILNNNTTTEVQILRVLQLKSFYDYCQEHGSNNLKFVQNSIYVRIVNV